MKFFKRFIFVISIFLISLCVVKDANAQTLTFRYLSYSNSGFSQVGQFYGSTLNFTSGANEQQQTQVFYSSSWQYVQGASYLKFEGLVAVSSGSLTNKLQCSYSYQDVDGVQWCTVYDTVYAPKFSIAVNVLQGSARFYCDVQVNGGLFTATCPLQGSDISSLSVVVTRSGSGSTSQVFVGLGKDAYYISGADNSDIIDNQNQNSQKEIDAMNKNQQQAHSDAQAQLNQDKANAQQAHQDSQNEVNATNKNTEAVNNMNDTISDSNVDVDGSFFSGFDNDTHGLTAIITSPLQLIGSITSSKCSPLGIPIPFVNQTVQLPCMGDIYKKHFGSFLTLYQTITFGMVAYWVCVQLMFMVKGFKDPNSDKIEVMDL